MADNQRKELENEITKLSDEQLDEVAGGNACPPEMIKHDNACYTCAMMAAEFGVDHYLYKQICT